MTNDQLRDCLRARLNQLMALINQSCERAQRDPSSVGIVAVTKTVSPRVAGMFLDLGIRDLGESRPQELWRKAAALPDARFHLIGHLQRNKLERTIPQTYLVHSADSERLLKSLAEFGLKQKQPVKILLEVNISGEPVKAGFIPAELVEVYRRYRDVEGLKILGLMGMAAYTSNPEAARPAFRILANLREQLRQTFGEPVPELSMGMSGDFTTAIEEGSTLIRPGTILFEGLESIV